MDAFKVSTGDGNERHARYVIYAGGEFGHPYEPPNLKTEEGATIHYSKVPDWSLYIKAGRAVVVGGGETCDVTSLLWIIPPFLTSQAHKSL